MSQTKITRESQRNKNINARVNGGELSEVDTKAERYDATVSDFLRTSVLDELTHLKLSIEVDGISGKAVVGLSRRLIAAEEEIEDLKEEVCRLRGGDKPRPSPPGFPSDLANKGYGRRSNGQYTDARGRVVKEEVGAYNIKRFDS